MRKRDVENLTHKGSTEGKSGRGVQRVTYLKHLFKLVTEQGVGSIIKSKYC